MQSSSGATVDSGPTGSWPTTGAASGGSSYSARAITPSARNTIALTRPNPSELSILAVFLGDSA